MAEPGQACSAASMTLASVESMHSGASTLRESFFPSAAII